MNHKEIIKGELKKFDYNDSKLRLTLGVLIVVVLCTFLIVIATFTELSFSSHKMPVDGILHPLQFLSQTKGAWLYILGYQYIPQIPVVLFIAALLGNRFGFLSVLLYIIIGLTVAPVFALGGGWIYIFEHNFGYILAFLPAVVFAGSILSRKINFINALKAAFWGVFIMHFIGVLYTTIITIFHRDSFEFYMDVIAIQSGIKIIYDYVFSVIAIMLARPVKKVLWLAMG